MGRVKSPKINKIRCKERDDIADDEVLDKVDDEEEEDVSTFQ